MAKYFIADNDTDLENGWTIETDLVFCSQQFWEECDREVGVMVTKAVQVDSDCNWVGDNYAR